MKETINLSTYKVLRIQTNLLAWKPQLDLVLRIQMNYHLVLILRLDLVLHSLQFAMLNCLLTTNLQAKVLYTDPLQCWAH